MQESYDPKKLIGRDVFDARLRKVGTVSDVALGLIVGTQIIPVERISEVGDIIRLKDEHSIENKSARVSMTEKTCPKCGKLNEPWTKFCMKCGNKF